MDWAKRYLTQKRAPNHPRTSMFTQAVRASMNDAGSKRQNEGTIKVTVNDRNDFFGSQIKTDRYEHECSKKDGEHYKEDGWNDGKDDRTQE